jgi:hypothetical protein
MGHVAVSAILIRHTERDRDILTRGGIRIPGAELRFFVSRRQNVHPHLNSGQDNIRKFIFGQDGIQSRPHLAK